MAATGINEIEYAAIREVLPHEAVEVIHALDDRLPGAPCSAKSTRSSNRARPPRPPPRRPRKRPKC